MRLVQLLIATAVFSGGVLATGEARADYLCSVAYFPGPTGAGTEGSVQIQVNTGPACGGSVVGSYFLCTGGASVSACTSIGVYRFDRSGIQAMFAAVQRAASDNQRVKANTTSACNGGGTSCLSYVTFFSD
jgi:hypothetical protein